LKFDDISLEGHPMGSMVVLETNESC
jgi:hypothetical protein